MDCFPWGGTIGAVFVALVGRCLYAILRSLSGFFSFRLDWTAAAVACLVDLYWSCEVASSSFAR